MASRAAKCANTSRSMTPSWTDRTVSNAELIRFWTITSNSFTAVRNLLKVIFESVARWCKRWSHLNSSCQEVFFTSRIAFSAFINILIFLVKVASISSSDRLISGPLWPAKIGTMVLLPSSHRAKWTWQLQISMRSRHRYKKTMNYQLN